MPDFVVAHGLDDGPAAQVVGWKALEMPFEMAFDLPLRFRHEPEAGAIAEQSREGADPERSCIPERVKYAGSGAELFQTGLAPGQVVGLLASSMEHEFAHFGIPGEQGLRVIERLGGYLAGMIHPHQGCGFASVVGGKGW